MPATVTLSTTTLSAPVDQHVNVISLASTSGVSAGKRLFVDGELMQVLRLGVGTQVVVARGVDGTAGAEHPSNATVYIGDAHQFYSKDPVGRPHVEIPVSPYINVLNGSVWFARGDTSPSADANRWWQKQTTTYGTSGVGVLTSTLDPTAST
jgi:hypothetical protein